jgi:dTDP-glucose 4,6-dehydratase
MRVIITGGAGFIGSHAVQHFVESGDDVLNIDKLTYASRLELLEISKFKELDVCDTDFLIHEIKEHNPDFLIHFAAETHVDKSIDSCQEFVRTNVNGVASVLDACRVTKVKLCHISTDEVYGPALNRPYFESDSLNPRNPYSATKAAGDMLVKSYENTYNVKNIIIRPSNNYGPRQHSEKFIPKLINCLENGQEFPLYGAGDQEREWTFVEDTVKIIRQLLLSNMTMWNSTYNLSSGICSNNLSTSRAVIDVYNRIKGKNFRLEDVVKVSKDRPGHDKKYWISTEKLKSILKFNYTEFQHGLIKTISQEQL